jgi:YHS domain-containing protein
VELSSLDPRLLGRGFPLLLSLQGASFAQGFFHGLAWGGSMMGLAMPTRDEEEVVDVVCGEVFPPSLAVFRSELDGQKYWFCCETCKKTFDAAPEDHLSKEVEE